jgi:uncharacterized membrane protein YfcA
MYLSYVLTFKDRLDRIPLLLFLPVLVLVYTTLYLLGDINTLHPIQFNVKDLFTAQFFIYLLVGFGAQLIDGALGMAYGVSASSFLMAVGVSPASASAAVHVAEVFTTGASGISHFTLGNVNRRLFKALVLPGVLGAIAGAFLLTSIDGEILKPFVAAYLLVMGFIILRKAMANSIEKKKLRNIKVLALAGGFLDSIGGGGWGPVVTSTLLSKGRNPQYTIGSVNAAEFLIAFSSAGVFTWMMGLQNVSVIAGLIAGGVAAAPFGAFVVGRIAPKRLMALVGVLIIALSLRTFYKFFL